MLKASFFNRDACLVAQQLLGKIIRRKHQGHWLAARIIETEAYYIEDKGSHAVRSTCTTPEGKTH